MALLAVSSSPHAATWTYFEHPDFVGATAGPDGLIGTADDGSAPGFNLAGATTFSFTTGAPVGSAYLSMRGTLDLNLESFTRIGPITRYTDFTHNLATVDYFTGITGSWVSTSDEIDLNRATHTFTSSLDVVQTNAFGNLLSSDVPYVGYVLVRGENPDVLRGDPAGAFLVDYLEAEILPRLDPDWTGVFVGGMPTAAGYPITAGSTSGSLASSFGGTTFYNVVGSTSDPLFLSSISSTPIAAGSAQLASLFGGSGVAGGIDVELSSVAGGELTLDLAAVSADDLLSGASGLPPINFQVVIGGIQYAWDIGFSGVLDGPAELTFGFDPDSLDAGIDAADIAFYHFEDTNGDGQADGWVALPATIDMLAGVATVTTTSLSPFVMGLVVPEPDAAALVAAAIVALLVRSARRRSLRAR